VSTITQSNPTPTALGLLSEDQAAELLGVKPQTLSLWRSAGRYDLPFVRVGRLIRYRLADLEAWLERRLVSSDNSDR
jgi:excisionase family DNA binding protein